MVLVVHVASRATARQRKKKVGSVDLVPAAEGLSISRAERSGRWFYVGMALAVVLAVVIGFSRSLRERSLAPGARVSPIVIAHMGMFFGWVALFCTQTLLAANGRIRMHRRLGVLGALLAAGMVVTGVPLALSAARRQVFGEDSLAFLLVILVDLVGFGVLIVAGICLRRHSATHKRLMLLAMMWLLPPAIFRFPFAADTPGVFAGVMTLFVAAPLVHDRLARRRLDRVSLWGGLALLASGPLRIAVAHTDAWLRLAAWLTR